jgi:hypothetical protein
VAFGTVAPDDVVMTARIEYPGGSVAGTPSITADPNGTGLGDWTCSFAANWNDGDNLALVVNASDGLGNSLEVVVPFSTSPTAKPC